MILWTDPAVQSAVIQTAGTIIAAGLAAICAAIIGKRISDRDKLKEKLNAAINDIAFLLEVEKVHVDLHKENSNESFKLRVRQAVGETGLFWSGRFTPGRAKALSQKIDL